MNDRLRRNTLRTTERGARTSVRLRAAIAAAVIAAALLAARDASSWPWTSDRIWFTPGPGTVDMLRLFESPEEWPHARAVLDVFEFYQGHLLTTATAGEGPNSYDAFVRVDAFRSLLRWGKRIAVEMAAVKDVYCTPDGSGMQASIARTLEALRNVQAAGGRVTYVAMDEPFIGGLGRRCGGPSLAPTADRLAVYIPAVRQAFPDVRIGLIEPYPFFAVADFVEMFRLLHDRGVSVDFLHIDGQRPPASPGREVWSGEILELSALAAQYKNPVRRDPLWRQRRCRRAVCRGCAPQRCAARTRFSQLGRDARPHHHPELGPVEHRSVHHAVEPPGDRAKYPHCAHQPDLPAPPLSEGATDIGGEHAASRFVHFCDGRPADVSRNGVRSSNPSPGIALR